MNRMDRKGWSTGRVATLVIAVVGIAGVVAGLQVRNGSTTIDNRVQGIDGNNPIIMTGTSFGPGSSPKIGTHINVAPAEPPHSFSRKLTLHQLESTAVHGVTIQSGLIGEWLGRGTYIELAVSDNDVTVFNGKAFDGQRIPVRTGADESLTVVVDDAMQYPKDPTKTWDDIKKLGIAGEFYIERKAILTISGKTRSKEPETSGESKAENDNSLYTINVDMVGPVDVRKMDADFKETYFIDAARTGNLHDLEVISRAGVDINCTSPLGNTALMTSAIYKQINAFKLLIKLGVDASIKNHDGESVFQYVKRFGMKDYSWSLENIKAKSSR